jgi:membrane protein required for colicin V production
MEIYDVIMLVVLGGMTLFGFLKGFAWQVASLASFVLSYLMAYRFSDALAPQLNTDPSRAKFIAMLVIFVGTSLVVWLAFRVVSGTIDRIKLREFDRQLGGLFGLLKGALFCTIITFFAVTLSEPSRAAVLKSKSGGHIARFLHEAKPVMPPELSVHLDPFIDKLIKGLDRTQTVEHPAIPNLPALPGVPNPMNPLQSPPQFQYPTYQPGGGQPATYPPTFDNQSGQNFAPQFR